MTELKIQEMTPADFQAMIDKSSEYMRPLWLAASCYGFGVCFLRAQDGPFSIPRTDIPFIAVVDDYASGSAGPSSFDNPSLISLFTRCAVAVIVATADPVPSELVSLVAALERLSVVIIETRQPPRWRRFLQAVAPTIDILVQPPTARRAGQ